MARIADLAGITGVICFLLAYLLLQKGTLHYTSLRYLGLNLAGSLLVMASLLVDWNLSAFLLEAAWALISVGGIIKTLARKTMNPDSRVRAASPAQN